MKNSQRVANLSMFRSDAAKILVTTDLTSRGLDISEVNLVINYHLPRTVADYVHRVGRTARNGLQGEAISLVTPNEVEIFQTIEK
jgi:superfamily II DNA/RNA helicase